jgi:hypothetical protein
MSQSIPIASFVPVVDLISDPLEVAQQTISNAARDCGLVFIRHLPMRVDFPSIQRLFDALYQSPDLANRLNNLAPRQGVFKLEGKWVGDDGVDDKASIALPVRALRSRRGDHFSRVMGEDFHSLAQFLEAVQDRLIPMIIQATSDAISSEVDLWNVHKDGNIACRLIDYHRTSNDFRPGARAHRDGSTATIIFQDGSGGLEVQSPSGQWCAVPGHETVIMWGHCGQMLSGDRIKAAYHRVTSIPSVRRNVAVIFLSPDDETAFQPLVPGHTPSLTVGNGIRVEVGNGMTVGAFKNLMKERRWENRGNNPGWK